MIPSHLECSRDASHRVALRHAQGDTTLATVCPNDGAPWLVRYDGARLSRESVRDRAWTMWRYREMLPIAEGEEPITLGEGGTPLLALHRVADELELGELYVKD
ncbi:MAG: hypothetical protein JO113_01765, partial [Candidatus Eremiobacteraeota bacterium]|nr:hypothetical protein [Candidatus Eremiobacteraeota bacterium]